MSNQEYWGNRAAWKMFEEMETAEGAADDIAAVYLKASRWLQLGMEGIFEKYMTKHKLSEAEARRLLDTMDSTTVQEMLRKLAEGESDKTKKELLAELEAPAYQARISRLVELQDQIDAVMRNVYSQEQQISTDFYQGLAEDAYYRSIFGIQKQTGLAFSFAHTDRKQIDRVLAMDWSGKHYSSRIWSNTAELAQDLKEELLASLLTGRTEREVSEILSGRFGVGAMKARRLVRTESCFVSGELTAQSYEECGIERYRYLATLDLKTSEACRELDNKVFPVSGRQAGRNYPPMHPWCRSTTVSVIDGEVLEKLTRRAFNPATGHKELVPASMDYKEWYEKYVKGSPKAQAEEKAYKNRSTDRKQHQEYRKVLGDEIPESFAKFQEMKYNESEKWDELKHEYRVVNQYEVVSGKFSPSDIVRFDKRFENEKSCLNSKLRSQGNIAIAEFNGTEYIAHSKIKNELSKYYSGYKGKSRFIFESQNRVFKTKTLPNPGGWDRKVDSEAKIFEYINSICGKEGDLKILNMMTKYPMCESCLGVLEQFKTKNPQVQVNIIQKRVIGRAKS